MTLHTGPGCFLDQNPPTPFSGTVGNADCEGNTGCGIADSDPTSFGAGLREAGGGVFAHLWNKDGIKIWHFKRSSIPQDITNNEPDPSTWPTPAAFFANTNCDMSTHFVDHSIVIDTTLCGDWAGAVYGGSGCPGTCAQAVSSASNFKSTSVPFACDKLVLN